MNKSLYPKLAFSNIVKNAKIYVPYILMGIFTITLYFMMLSIVNNESIRNMEHAQNILSLVNIGVWVTRIFSVIFLFYINSFLMKRRKKEIGLYNILGMEKKHIGLIMFFETLYIMIADIVAGIIFGMVFGKLMFLLLFKLIHADSVPAFDVQFASVEDTVILFAVIFAIILVFNIIRVQMTKPIELVRGGQTGEKEPKTKLVLFIVGVVAMGAGYYFALTTKNALQAMTWFFFAVIAVIIGTYCLFIAGSIVVLKLLKKNKNFYYKANHFTSVSGMIYRMKQNAVGLANICILSTMVLVSVSTTVCLYAGMDDTLKAGYPREILNTLYIDDLDEISNVEKAFENVNKNNGVEVKNLYENVRASFTANRNSEGEYIYCSRMSTSDEFLYLNIGCLDEYNNYNRSNYTLDDDEVLVYSSNGKYEADNFVIGSDTGRKISFKVKENASKLSDGEDTDSMMSSYVNGYTIIVKNKDVLKHVVDTLPNDDQNGRTQYRFTYNYDTNLSREKSIEYSGKLQNELKDEGINLVLIHDNRYSIADELQQMYGGFLFLGLFVGLLFSMATALIIYYKQISEGYDDKERFEIMQKVGMSHGEVKKSIRSQVLTVFFLPLIVAAIHVAASFKIIKQILKMLMFTNPTLFGWCTVATIVVFAAIYGLVFVFTARSYYKITEF